MNKNELTNEYMKMKEEKALLFQKWRKKKHTFIKIVEKFEFSFLSISICEQTSRTDEKGICYVEESSRYGEYLIEITHSISKSLILLKHFANVFTYEAIFDSQLVCYCVLNSYSRLDSNILFVECRVYNELLCIFHHLLNRCVRPD